MSFFSVLFRYQSHSSSQILKMYHRYHFVYQHVSLSNEDSIFCIILLCMYHVKVCIKEGPYVSLKVSKYIKMYQNVSMYQPRLPFESSHVSRISTICIIQLHHHYVIHVSLFLEKKYIMSIKSSLVHRICVSRIHKPYIHIIKIQYPHI